MSWTIRKLTPSLGVEITGIDLSKTFTENAFDRLREAWLAADGVVVLRDQQWTPQQLVAVGKRFGELFTESQDSKGAQSASREVAGVYQFYGMKSSSRGVIAVPPGSMVISGAVWHSEHSYEAAPPSVTVLRAQEIVVAAPPIGGDTLFSDQHLAYEALSDSFRKFLEPLKAVHRMPDTRNVSVHPVVRTHPETGRNALYVNPEFTSEIEGLPRLESEAVLKFLFAHATSPQFIYRHAWQTNDVVIWDNRSVLHYGDSHYAAGGYRFSQLVMARSEKPVRKGATA